MKGIIEKDENILYDYNENDDIEYLKTELNKKLPMRKKAVVGRKGSQYENKIVSRTISIEVGMQNSGLGVVLARENFINPATAIPSAISSLVHSIYGSIFVSLFKK